MSDKTGDMFGRSLRRPGFPLIPVCAGIVVGYILRGLFDSTFLTIIEDKRYKKISEKETTPAHCKPCPLCALCADCWRHDAIAEPYRPKSMYEVIRWYYFTDKHLYENLDDDPRIGLIGRWKEDVQDIQEQAVRIVSKEENTQWKLVRLHYGYKRIDPFRGTDYVLDMEVAESDGTEKGRKLVHLVRSIRPHVRLINVQNVAQETVVHFIVPLSRVTDRLRDFMQVYEKVVMETGVAASLLGVLFRDSPEDQTSLEQCKQLFDQYAAKYPAATIQYVMSTVGVWIVWDLSIYINYCQCRNVHSCFIFTVFAVNSLLPLCDCSASTVVSNVNSKPPRKLHFLPTAKLKPCEHFCIDIKGHVRSRYVEAEGEFSRAVGLDMGARQLPPDALLFFCDIDVDFDQGFLQRCRNNAEIGQQVFYPAVFSQYDPELVMEGIPGKPKPTNLRDINKYNGFWMYYGYGMACMFNQDYRSVGGFNLDIRGWGGEDVELYERHVKSDLQVFRAMDPALVHRYHGKTCDPALTRDQYRMCVGSLSETMASKAQLGVKLLTLQGKLPPAA
ncbi:chondroitin sulfate synthase 1-like [Branchiostoma lanceolatum]|uniref:chondroitin sulfate synthase 1-like n=1 Tax=Branchiostoma lanceolatum TaxID=7740 RepID=UPI003454B17A